MIYRTTTSGNLKGYSFNLQRSRYTLTKTMNTFLSGRNFDSYKEDTAAASRSFQLRSNYSKTSSQLTVSESIVSKYEVAWDTLDTVISDVNKAKGALTRAANEPTGSGRRALGQELGQIAQSIVQYMNSTYSDNYVFAGADGLNAPLELDLETGALTYRGKDVTDGDLDTLNYLATGEVKYIDLGMGLDEGNLNSTSFNTSLSAIYYLGYGEDADGDPKNIVSLTYELSQMLQNCDIETGDFVPEEDEERFNELFNKFEDAMATLTNRYTELDATASYLKSNHTMLTDRKDTLEEQISNLEDVDAVEALTAYEWADYCYNAALQMGNSVLSTSLMDYLTF